MRRADLEIQDTAECIEVINACDCCRVGFYDAKQQEVYIVPMNFGYEETEGQIHFYFHGAFAGRKYELIREKPNVGFEMDTNYALTGEGKACNYSARYKSIIGNGQIQEVTDLAEKEKALNLIMKHYTGKESWMYSEQELKAVAVFRLDVISLSGKSRG